jgi:hypothetical protein
MPFSFQEPFQFQAGSRARADFANREHAGTARAHFRIFRHKHCDSMILREENRSKTVRAKTGMFF